MDYFLNPYLFFLIVDKKIVLWDYLNHQQFEISSKYFNRLKFWTPSNYKDALDSIDKDLLEFGILQKQPFETYEWEWDALSKIYHIGTQNIPTFEAPDSPEEWISGYGEYCKKLTYSPSSELLFEREGEKIALPPPQLSLLSEKTYLEVLKARKTNRVFKPEPIELEIFSALLFATFGKFHGEEWSDFQTKGLSPLGMRKSSPSGGGLHPIEAYIIVFNVKTLKKGIYHYSVKHHALTLIKDSINYEELIPYFYNQFYIENISFGVFLVANFDKCWEKYPHSRAYRIVLMDAGHVSQTFLLNATAAGLNTFLSAAFKDKEISTLLGIDGVTQSPLHFVAAGMGGNTSLTKIDLYS